MSRNEPQPAVVQLPEIQAKSGDGCSTIVTEDLDPNKKGWFGELQQMDNDTRAILAEFEYANERRPT